MVEVSGTLAVAPFADSASYVRALLDESTTATAREAATRRAAVQPALFTACERWGLSPLERRALACVVAGLPLRWVDAAPALRRLNALTLIVAPEGIARPTPRLLALVADELELDSALGGARLVRPLGRAVDEDLVPHALLDELVELLDARQLACISSEPSVGAAPRVAAALARCGRATIVVPVALVVSPSSWGPLGRELTLFDAALVVDAAAALPEQVVEAARALEALGRAAVLACDDAAAVRQVGLSTVELALGPPAPELRRRLWQRVLDELAIPSELSADELSTLPLPRPGLIRELAQLAARWAERLNAPVIDAGRWEAAQARLLGAPSLGRIARQRGESAPSLRLPRK